jgi:hypothetical protein
MPDQNDTMMKADVSHLHAATCLAITQFMQGRRCPCLANRIVLLLQYLATHPDLPLTSTSKDLYLNLLDYWQQVNRELKQRNQQGLALILH